MKAIQKLIYTGFAAVAIASASMPVFPAHTAPARSATWPGVDWHEPVVVVQPAPRAVIIDRR